MKNKSDSLTLKKETLRVEKWDRGGFAHLKSDEQKIGKRDFQFITTENETRKKNVQQLY